MFEKMAAQIATTRVIPHESLSFNEWHGVVQALRKNHQNIERLSIEIARIRLDFLAKTYHEYRIVLKEADFPSCSDNRRRSWLIAMLCHSAKSQEECLEAQQILRIETDTDSHFFFIQLMNEKIAPFTHR